MIMDDHVFNECFNWAVLRDKQMSNELQFSKQMSNKVVVVEHKQVSKVPISWRDAMWVSDLAIDQGALWMHCCPLVNVILCCPWESAVWGKKRRVDIFKDKKLMISALSSLLDVGLMRSCSWTRQVNRLNVFGQWHIASCSNASFQAEKITGAKSKRSKSLKVFLDLLSRYLQTWARSGKLNHWRKLSEQLCVNAHDRPLIMWWPYHLLHCLHVSKLFHGMFCLIP